MHHACYTGAYEHHLNDGSVHNFKPTGELHVVRVHSKHRRGAREKEDVGYDSVVEDWGVGLAARLFVGLKVGDVPTYTIDDVMRATYEFLVTNGDVNGNSTFLAQKGWYFGVSEDSVQIVIFDEYQMKIERFTMLVLQLGAYLRDKFTQKSVIVEIQKGGVAQRVVNVKKEGT